MGFEVRKVPANWEHPKSNGEYISLLDNFSQDLALWNKGEEDWAKGIFNRSESIPPQFKDYSWDDFAEPCPNPDDYMPKWDESGLTHYQMYNTNQGIPVSPIFATEDELIDWLTENQVEAFGRVIGDRDFLIGIIETDRLKNVDFDDLPDVRTDTDSDIITITDSSFHSVAVSLKEWKVIAESVSFVYDLDVQLAKENKGQRLINIALTTASVLLFLIQLLLLKG